MSIHQSTKVLFEHVFHKHTQALLEDGNSEETRKLADTLLKVASDTIDDNERLLNEVVRLEAQLKEQSALAAGGS